MKGHGLAAMLLLSLILLTGCWDRVELNQLGMVWAVAFDPAPEESGDKVEITAQVLNPQPPGQTVGQGGGGGQEPFVNLSATGRSTVEASNRMAVESARRPSFGQTQLIILGQDLAKTDMRILIERPGRGFEARRAARLVVAKAVSGKELLSTNVKLAGTPAQGMISILEAQTLTGFVPDIRLRDFLAALNSQTAAAVTPALTVIREDPAGGKQAEPLVRAVGTAVFRNGRLVGYLTLQETRGFLWEQGRIRETIVNVPFPGAPPDQIIGIGIRRAFSSITMEADGHQVKADISIEVRADISEYGVLRDIAKPRSWSILNEELSRVVKDEIEHTVRKSQALRADIFNLGEQLRRQDNES
ncbi:MAG: Ger(x)C family spore germination protein, partial [Candidatus Desulforudis sp.]|nr:Ger(x)C family spore germination protein [Desulforudis sp.]